MSNIESQQLKDSQSLGRKKRLKKLLDRGMAIQSGMQCLGSSSTLQEIRQIIKDSDTIINEGSIADRAERTSEVVMDTHVLKMNHELVSKVIMQTSQYSDKMYLNAINRIVDTDFDNNWYKITKRACKIAQTTRTKSTMLGAIDAQPTEIVVKERRQRSRTTIANETKPEAIEKMNRREGREKVKIIYKQLTALFLKNNRKPIPFYELIIDPQNFMNTVQNAFQMSFLAREGKISIQTGDDGYPHVQLCETTADYMEAAQSICSLNVKFCNDMIRLYDIKKPMLQIPIDVSDED